MSAVAARVNEAELHEYIGSFANDPLGFVSSCYRWPIHGETGPDGFQREFLTRWGDQIRARAFDGDHAVLPIQMGTSSGHGIGKTVLTAWIVHFVLSTRPHCRGTVTANTNDQLEKKTWAAVREWHQHLEHRHWFVSNANIMFREGFRTSWFVAPASCAEENSEAFAGQHAKSSTSLMVFDEASAVPDKIWEVAFGAMTDGEPMFFAFGNPTRNTGMFHRIAFGDKRERWDVQIIDSRASKFSNKALLAEWIEEYGEDSDFVRVRVRGLSPNADELQWIDARRIHDAQIRVVEPLPDEPLVMGVDVSGGGSAMTVAAFRKGSDARAIPWVTLTGEQTQAHDRQLVVAKLAELLTRYDVAACNLDTAFGAPIATRLRDMGYRNVFEVTFGGPSPDPTCANLRAAMYRAVKDWLGKSGCIDQHDHRLATDLAAPGWHLNKSNKLTIEDKASMSKRGVASVDRADALALTFATKVAPKVSRQPRWGPMSQSPWA